MKRYSMRLVRSSILVVLALFFTLLSAYSSMERKLPHATREVTDMAGRKMVVPSVIRRIYVNKPGSVLMYAVAPDMLVSRSLWLTDNTKRYFKSSYLQLPYVDGSVEEIVRLKPDIIISSFNINPKTKDEANRLSQKIGIPVFMVPIDMGMYEQTFKALGELLNRKEQTGRMRAFLHTYFDGIALKSKQIPEKQRVRVYYAEGERGLNTDPSASFHSQILDVVGAINVAQVAVASGQGMSAVSMEQLLLWNPEVVLVWTGMGSSMSTMHAIQNDNLWATVRAVKNKKLYQIPFMPFGWFDRPPSTNRIMGAIWTAQQLYPGIYHYDLKKVTREYFDIFYHYKLTDEELAALLHPNPQLLINSTSGNH